MLKNASHAKEDRVRLAGANALRGLVPRVCMQETPKSVACCRSFQAANKSSSWYLFLSVHYRILFGCSEIGVGTCMSSSDAIWGNLDTGVDNFMLTCRNLLFLKRR